MLGEPYIVWAGNNLASSRHSRNARSGNYGMRTHEHSRAMRAPPTKPAPRFLMPAPPNSQALSRQVKQVQQVDEDMCYDDVEAPTPPLEGTAANAGLSPKAKKQQAMASAATAPIDDVPPTYDELEADGTSPVCMWFLVGLQFFRSIFRRKRRLCGNGFCRLSVTNNRVLKPLPPTLLRCTRPSSSPICMLHAPQDIVKRESVAFLIVCRHGCAMSKIWFIVVDARVPLSVPPFRV